MDREGSPILLVVYGGQLKKQVFCNKYPRHCDDCKLRFKCYVNRPPEFTPDELKAEGITC